MGFRLLLLFVILPVVEIWLLFNLADRIGGLETVGIVIATGMLGSYLAKSQGLSVWNRLNNRLSTASLPGEELTEGMIILVSGAFLLTPGVITDFVGFLGLIPFTRKYLAGYLRKRFKKAIASGKLKGNVSFGTGAFGTGSFGPGGPMRPPRTDSNDISDVVDEYATEKGPAGEIR